VSEPRPDTTRSIGVALIWLAVAAALFTAIVAASGGFRFDIAGIPVSIRTAARPLIAAIAFGIAGVIALRGAGAHLPFQDLHHTLNRRGWLMASGFALAIGFTSFLSGAHLAGGTDSSGYLSEARLWRERSLRIATPLANELAFANGQHPFIPAGYQPAGTGAGVPGYPPGFPLMLALAGSIAGEQAAFAVVPLSAAGLIVVAFMLGRRLGGPDTALVAAAAVGASPILIFQSLQPMSDVPAAFWWSLAVLLLTHESNRMAAFGGAAAAIACLVRPNLFALVPLLAGLSVWWRGWTRVSWLRAFAFVVTPAIAAAAFVYLQQVMFGGATRTGYGPVETLFSIEHVGANIGRYSRWTVFVQSALIAVSIAGPLAIRRRWVESEMDAGAAARVAWSGLVLYAALQTTYLLYLVFDDWVYFRFLLPALPLVLILESAVLAAACRRARLPLRGLAVLLTAVLVASWGVGRARSVGAFGLRQTEHRYLDVAEYVRGLPPDAVFVTLQYSGSLWYYRSATLLRWDVIDADEIDAAIAHLSAKGRPVFAVLDDSELPRVRTRFTGTRFVQRLTSPIFQSGHPNGIKAQIYTISGTTTGAAGARVSSPPPPAIRIPRTPGAPDLEWRSARWYRR
jgi:4-amino-4-deoxy-L-arabinose transferase-like glycosyltransferase